MNRRTLLKTSFMASTVTALPFANMFAKNTSSRNIVNRPIFSHFFTLGDLELTVLTDGHILQKPIQPFMCPKAPQETLDAILKENFRSIDSVDLAMNVLLIKKGSKYILLDAGMGIFSDSQNTDWLLESLSDAGIKPSDITDIMISHAHPDHIGGLVNKSHQLVFPNATVYISKTEYDFWKQASIKDFSKSELRKNSKFLAIVIPEINKIFTTIRPKLKFYPENELLFETFQFTPIPGHTPGMQMITIHSKEEKLAYIADLIHHDILLFQHPEWGFSGDTDLDLATQTRIKTLNALSDSKTRIFAYHLPWPGLGFAKKENGNFRWIPEVFATPESHI